MLSALSTVSASIVNSIDYVILQETWLKAYLYEEMRTNLDAKQALAGRLCCCQHIFPYSEVTGFEGPCLLHATFKCKQDRVGHLSLRALKRARHTKE